MSLHEELSVRASEIYKEAYQMSIGELANLYREGELDIHPEFQRVYRWSDDQKTRLIESIMLNIPIPQIFVSQNEEGVWDVIDGVQRLSTIFQFMGILKDDEGNLIEPLTLTATDLVPSFENVRWSNEGDEENPVFTMEQQRALKRSRIDIIILKKESDANTKYELFQRLNTGGTNLTAQEVRNCLIIMTNKPFYMFVKEIDEFEAFRNCIPVTHRKSDEQYRMEMIIRLFVAANIDWTSGDKYKTFSELLDKEILKLCDDIHFDFANEKEKFRETFRLLDGALGENTFRRCNDGKFSGPFLASAFEAIAIGVFCNLNYIQGIPNNIEWIKKKVEAVYEDGVFIENTSPGIRAINRFKALTTWSIENFGQ